MKNYMKTSFKTPSLLVLALVLSGCNLYSFNREMGDMDPGDFGNANMQNQLLAKGQMQPAMGHDKYDAPRAGSRLNGKYAAKIWSRYAGGGSSAAPAASTLAIPAAPPAAN